tara:strand:+ start:840 stop:1172 length:333 start_codon:yes stop_codon:yes gene_type:complete
MDTIIRKNTMRKMQGKSLGEDGICTVVEHIIIKNMWEYYILKTDLDEADDSYRTALVVGDYTEIGGVDLREIEPHIVSRTSDLGELIPAPGWEWVTDEEAHEFLNTPPSE